MQYSKERWKVLEEEETPEQHGSAQLMKELELSCLKNIVSPGYIEMEQVRPECKSPYQATTLKKEMTCSDEVYSAS